MQTKSPFFDEIAKAMENAAGLAQAAGEEARAVLRAQADRLTAEFDLVRRDELEALKARFESELSALRAELAQLKPDARDVRPLDDAG